MPRGHHRRDGGNSNKAPVSGMPNQGPGGGIPNQGPVNGMPKQGPGAGGIPNQGPNFGQVVGVAPGPYQPYGTATGVAAAGETSLAPEPEKKLSDSELGSEDLVQIIRDIHTSELIPLPALYKELRREENEVGCDCQILYQWQRETGLPDELRRRYSWAWDRLNRVQGKIRALIKTIDQEMKDEKIRRRKTPERGNEPWEDFRKQMDFLEVE